MLAPCGHSPPGVRSNLEQPLLTEARHAGTRGGDKRHQGTGPVYPRALLAFPDERRAFLLALCRIGAAVAPACFGAAAANLMNESLTWRGAVSKRLE